MQYSSFAKYCLVKFWKISKTLETSDKVCSEEPALSVNGISAEILENQNPKDQAQAHQHKLEFKNDEGRIEYLASNQHNGYQLDGYVLRRTSFDSHVGSLGMSLYEDGKWHTTATVPPSLGLKRFGTPDEAIDYAQSDARKRGLMALPQTGQNVAASDYDSDNPKDPILSAGFTPLGRDCLGWEEYGLKADAEDGGIYAIRLSRAGEEVTVKVQYEKDHIIDGRRTIKGNFNNLEQALDFVGSYTPLPEIQKDTDSLTRTNKIRFR